MLRSMSVNHVVQVSLKNMEYLPLFYLMPKRILQEYHFSIKIIPRVPWEILNQPFLCRLIESDLFLAMLKKMIADLVWPYLCFNPMDFYSEKLGYQNHSGILKCIRKIGQAYETFTGEDYGFEEKKIV